EAPERRDAPPAIRRRGVALTMTALIATRSRVSSTKVQRITKRMQEMGDDRLRARPTSTTHAPGLSHSREQRTFNRSAPIIPHLLHPFCHPLNRFLAFLTRIERITARMRRITRQRSVERIAGSGAATS